MSLTFEVRRSPTERIDMNERNAGAVASTEELGPNAQRESVDDALMIVESYGPWGADLNDAHRRQIVLADEVLRLRHLYEMAVRGRAEMRTALRQERDQLEARYMALLKAVADGRAMQPAPPMLVALGPN